MGVEADAGQGAPAPAEVSAGKLPLPAALLSPRVEDTSSRIANLKEKMRMIGRSKSKKLNFNSMTDLVEEARQNRSSVNQNMSIAGSELSSLLAVPPEQRLAMTWREIVEYGRKVELPLPDSLNVKQRLCAWHQCLTKLTLQEFDDGQTIVTEGAKGGEAYCLLKGAAAQAPPPQVPGQDPSVQPTLAAPSDVPSLGIIGKEVLLGRPVACTVRALGKVTCAALAVADYLAAVEEAVQMCHSSSTLQSLKQLLLLARPERSPIHLEDLACKLSVYELFRFVDPEFRTELGSISEYISVPAGTTLFNEGDKVCFCFLILSGSVALQQRDPTTQALVTALTLSAGEHFGSLSTLLGNDKRRTTSAVALEACEFAAISRVTYSRLQKKQLQEAVEARMAMVKGMSFLVSAPESVQARVAFNSRSESFEPGQTVLNPACYPSKLFVIMEGECKLVWATEELGAAPDEPMPIAQHCALYHHGAHPPHTSGGTAAGGVAHAQLYKEKTLQSPLPSTSQPQSHASRAIAPHSNPHTSCSTPFASGQDGSTGSTASSSGQGKVRHEDDDLPEVVSGPESRSSSFRRSSSLRRNSSSLHGASWHNDALQETHLSVCGCGCAVPQNHAPPRQRHVLEVARLGRGDLINGAVVSGMAPVLTVVATTAVRLMSIDSDAIEAVFGAATFARLKALITQQFELNKQRLQQMVAVRQGHGSSFLAMANARQIGEDPASQALFLEHYVSPGPSDLRPLPDPAAPPRGSTRLKQGTLLLPALPQAASPTATPRLPYHSIAPTLALTPRSVRGTPSTTRTSSPALFGHAVASSGPVSFEDVCAVRASTFTSHGKSRSRLTGGSVQEVGLPHLSAAPTPASHARSNPVTGPAQGGVPGGMRGIGDHQARPVPSPEPNQWAGNLHACLGDMFETLSSEQPPQPDASDALRRQSQSGLSSSQQSPPMASPALMSKTKVQPAVSVEAARACTSRGGFIMSLDSTFLDSAFASASAVTQLPKGHAMAGVGMAQGSTGAGNMTGGGAGFAGQMTEHELAANIAVLPGRMTSYESILQPVVEKKNKRVEMLHDLALNTAWGPGQALFEKEQQARLRHLQAQRKKEERERHKIRQQQQENADLGWGIVQKARKGNEGGSLTLQELSAHGLATRSDSRGSNTLGTGRGNSGRQRVSNSGSTGGSSFRVRSVKAWQRPDEEINLPLDRDALAPSLHAHKGHGLSTPMLQDIKYLLGRWGDRWASDREEVTKARQHAREAAARKLQAQHTSRMSAAHEEDELWDLDLYGAPTFGPGL